jgi:hypothetical protein
MNLNHEQEIKETVMSLINKIFKDPRFFKLRLMIIFSVAISFITIFYNNMLFSCQLYLLQNVLLVYLIILMLFSLCKISDRSDRIKLGVSLATIFGGLYAGITLLIDNIQYYFFGFRERAFAANGLIASQANRQIFLAQLGSQLVLWLILILISRFAGFLASITRQRVISK